MFMGWRDALLTRFDRDSGTIFRVVDPNGLVRDERVQAELRTRGFELLLWKSAAEGHLVYARWKANPDVKSRPALVVVTLDAGTAQGLPADLRGPRSIDLGVIGLDRLFPRLSYPVIRELDTDVLDRLEEAASRLDRDLGDAETRAFVLRHGYAIDLASVHAPEDLLRLLFELHTRARRLSRPLAEHIVAALQPRAALDAIPLAQWVVDRGAFVAAVQAQWPGYLTELTGGARCDASAPVLNFDAVRPQVATLFLDGVLSPVNFEPVDALPAWARVGVARATPEDKVARLARLVEHAEKVVPGDGAAHQDWSRFAWTWAELTRAYASLARVPDGDLSDRLAALRSKVDASFARWMLVRYGLLASAPRPAYQPVMVHHAVELLAHRRGPKGRVALVVVDGMALDQWLVLRDALRAHDPSLRFVEDTAFAWVPTVTSVSRGALFTGRLPMDFAQSVKSLKYTSSEEAGWKRAWKDRGVGGEAVRYERGQATENPATVETIAGHPGVLVAGLVLNKLDELMHGAELGLAQLHRDVALWAEQGTPYRTLRGLLDSGFQVFVTADHGNVEALGMDRPDQGVLVESSGERARVYDNETFRKQAHAAFADTIEWPELGLPTDAKVLLAGGRRAFLRVGERAVVHGGITLEEVLVPFVEVQRA